MDLDSDVSSDEVPQAAHPPSKHVCSPQASERADHWHSAAADLDADSEWQARLREESGAEHRGYDEEDWDKWDDICNPDMNNLV